MKKFHYIFETDVTIVNLIASAATRVPDSTFQFLGLAEI